MAKKIYINPGHSNSDPGAVGFEVERELNVKVSNYMNEYLVKNFECETKMTPGTLSDLVAIANEANVWGADLMVSNHFNAGKGNGYEGLIYSLKNVELGQIFEKYVKAVGQNSRGVKCRPDLAILKYTKMPAILNEGAFVDNKTDIQDWNDDAELKRLGEAYAKAAAEYLDLPKKKVEQPKNETVAVDKVKVTVNALNIRSGPGTNYKVVGCIRDKGVYTIVEKSGEWGKLKSGAGWIHLAYTKKL